MSGRVTLLQCKWCGAIAAKRGTQFIVLTDGDATRDCADGGREVHQPEPIDFAPLPSEEARKWILFAAREGEAADCGCTDPKTGLRCGTCESEKSKIAAAIAEIEKAWKP